MTKMSDNKPNIMGTQYLECFSFRLLFIVTLFLIIARCYLEISAVHFEKFRRERYANSKPEDFFAKQSQGQAAKTTTKLEKVENESENLRCHSGITTSFYYTFGGITTDWNLWTYRVQVVCPYVLANSTSVKRSGKHVHCQRKNSKIEVHTSVPAVNNVQAMPFGSLCLDAYIRACCITDQMPVPNIVHYIWYGKKDVFSFYGFLSFISVIRFVRPCIILIHGDNLPSGVYWNFILDSFTKIIYVHRKIEDEIFGKRPKHRNHISDIIRIEALLRYGGIYLDMDMVLVKEITFLRRYSCTMSRMRSHLLASSFIMAEKNASFLQKWLDGYRFHYRNDSYIYSAMNYPSQLSYNYTNLIHVEYETLSRPWAQHGDTIYYTNFNWSALYGIHLYNRIFYSPVNESAIRQMNTTFGSISRHILYGNKELCIT